MIVVHLSAGPGEWYLWAEVPVLKSKGALGKSTSQLAPKLPFGAKKSQLLEVAAVLGLSTQPPLKVTAPTLLIPTTTRGPLASSALVWENNVEDHEPTAVPVLWGEWRADALVLSWPLALQLLAGVGREPLLAPGLVAGPDFQFWAKAMVFAAGLVARQQFLPGVRQEGKKYASRWTPVYSGQDANAFLQLAGEMPGICRAVRGLKTALGPVADPNSLLKTTAETFPASGLLMEPEVTLCRADELLHEVVLLTVDLLARCATAPPPVEGVSVGSLNKLSFHDRWLRSLRTETADLKISEEDYELLQEGIARWRHSFDRLANAPWKLCFRLEEPAQDAEEEELEEGEPDFFGAEAKDAGLEPVVSAVPQPLGQKPQWTLRFLLQNRADPSLICGLEAAWPSQAQGASLAGCNLEFLYASLGLAARMSACVNHALSEQEPLGVEMDAVQAHAFLMEEAHALNSAGFGVFLPSWWTRSGTKARLAARAVVKSPTMTGGGLSMDEVMQFNWELALNGEKVSLEELQELAKLKQPLVRFRGQWVQLGPNQLQAAQEFWKKKRPQTNVRDLMRMALGGSSFLDAAIPIEGVEASGWLQELLQKLKGDVPYEELAASQHFRGQLRPYQNRGFSWLEFLRSSGLGACLADDMGLGKTPTTLAFLQHRRDSGDLRPVLLVCPTSVITNWEKEAARFTPQLKVLVHHGLGRSKGDKFKEKIQKYAIVVSSYALLARDHATLSEVGWSALVLDEAQNIKNPETQQSKAARSVPADYKLALTGTPVENSVGDLWSIMEFLNPGFLGNQAEFRRRFFVPIQNGDNPEAVVQLQKLTTPFILRRLKTDKSIITDLPEKQEMKVFCSLTREQGSLYEAVVRETARALETADGMARRGLVLATLVKLKQVCNHPAHFLGDNSAIAGRSAKLARLTEMLEEVLAGGERALIFTQFREMGDILRTHLQESFGREVLFLHGGVTKSQRDKMVERFSQPHGGPPLFVLSLKAGGVGLNLTGANHVFHFDRWWNPAVENQATDRAFRIGQTRMVQVHKFLCAGTLEEKIDEMIERKRSVADQVVGTGEGWLTELSTQDLKELFALRTHTFND